MNMKKYALPALCTIMFSITISSPTFAEERNFARLDQSNAMLKDFQSRKLQRNTLTSGFADASWYKWTISGLDPVPGRKPVIVMTQGWVDGTSDVRVPSNDPRVQPVRNQLLASGYIVLEVGYSKDPSLTDWNSDIQTKIKSALDTLCNNNSIPANCGAIVLMGSSYSGNQLSQSLAHLVENGYNSTNRKILGVVSQHAGYYAGKAIDNNKYSVAMIESIGDNAFREDKSHAQDRAKAFGKNAKNVYSYCPSGSNHGHPDNPAEWNNWVVGVTRHIIKTRNPNAAGRKLPQQLVKEITGQGNNLTYTNACAT